jgi:hypothetical protein
MIVSPRASSVLDVYLWKNNQFVQVHEVFLMRLRPGTGTGGVSAVYDKVLYWRREGYDPDTNTYTPPE